MSNKLNMNGGQNQQQRLLFICVVFFCFSQVLLAGNHGDKKGDPLFPPDHPNITYLTDDNWSEMMAKTDKPWLVDFYHPFCPHCKHFVPAFTEVAAYYKVEGSIHIGAISCMDHVQCRRSGIKGFPTLMALNFNTKQLGENKRVIGTHTVQEVKDYVNGLFLQKKINETGTQPPPPSSQPSQPPSTTGDQTNPTTSLTTSPEVVDQGPQPGEQVRKEIWEESTLPMNHTTRLRDAASAFVFGLKQGVFMGREILEDMELDALKEWLHIVSKTFPGSINRQIIIKLYEKTQPIALLDYDKWEEIVNEWQKTSVEDFKQAEAKLDFEAFKETSESVPEWQRLSDLFVGFGADYTACALYTCGQWNMFHMMTMNPPEPNARSDELMVSVIAVMRRFMKHFFGCVQCRDHFLEYNNLDMVKTIHKDPNKPRALKRWLWEMHNAVNTRIFHPLWPKPDVCPTCGGVGNWIDVEVDKWLGNTYAFKEVIVPEITHPPPHVTAATAGGGLRKNDDQEVKEAEEPIAPSKPPAHTSIVTKKPTMSSEDAGRIHANFHAGTGGAGNGAPPVTLFAWYILPVAAVGGYLFFVRRKAQAKLHFKRQQRK